MGDHPMFPLLTDFVKGFSCSLLFRMSLQMASPSWGALQGRKKICLEFALYSRGLVGKYAILKAALVFALPINVSRSTSPGAFWLGGAPPAVGLPQHWLHPKTEKCCLRRTHFKVGRHQGTSESKVSFTSCLMRCLHLIDFWRQHRCILRCLWYPTILCVPFLDGWAKK